jgi:hypothetical protein
MSNETIASIARELVNAMLLRAKSRAAEDTRRVLELQTELCAAVRSEAADRLVDAHDKLASVILDRKD